MEIRQTDLAETERGSRSLPFLSASPHSNLTPRHGHSARGGVAPLLFRATHHPEEFLVLDCVIG
jgi:hypothetical protein